MALRNVGQLAPGIESLERALRLDPGFADAHYNLALTYVRAREFDKAEQRWRALIARNPADTEAYKGLFDLKWLLGDYETALEALRAGIEANPATGDLRFSLADALLALGRFEEGWFRYLWRINRHE
ncbi:MAG: tetratricopeptide repeat protein [Burkholderiales bacterium]|nr:tetratricopeptide repeat protein [Burkholderiales bacterium]